MSICTRCGASFGCAMLEGTNEPCWCTTLPPVVKVPVPVSEQHAEQGGTRDAAPGCWCPACLRQHIAHQTEASSGTP